MMKTRNSKLVGGLMALSLALSFAVATARAAETQPSAKVTAKVGKITVIDYTLNSGSPSVTSDWVTILQNNIKTANQKDLFINPSLEVGLLTDTLVKSKGGTPDTSSALAAVEVQVLIDGRPALPGKPGIDAGVIYGRRTQTLTAAFQGICLTIDPVTGVPTLADTCDYETLQLVLDTMNANSFNFIMPDVSSGVHTVEVQARVNLAASAQAGSATARAFIGNGSVTIESVRMIRGEDIEL